VAQKWDCDFPSAVVTVLLHETHCCVGVRRSYTNKRTMRYQNVCLH